MSVFVKLFGMTAGGMAASCGLLIALTCYQVENTIAGFSRGLGDARPHVEAGLAPGSTDGGLTEGGPILGDLLTGALPGLGVFFLCALIGTLLVVRPVLRYAGGLHRRLEGPEWVGDTRLQTRPAAESDPSSADRDLQTARRLGGSATGVATLLILMATATLCWRVSTVMDHRLHREIDRTTTEFSAGLATAASRTLESGIGMADLALAMQPRLAEALTLLPMIRSVAIIDSSGRFRPLAGTASAGEQPEEQYLLALPGTAEGRQGDLLVTIDADYSRHALIGCLADIGIAMLVILIILIDVIGTVVGSVITGPLTATVTLVETIRGHRSARVVGRTGSDELGRLVRAANAMAVQVERISGDIYNRSHCPRPAESIRTFDYQLMLVRTAFFLFVTADAFCNSFLPVHARALPAPTAMLSEGMAASLPIAGFWLMVAAAQATTHLWMRGRDPRTLFGAAMLVSTVGLVLAGLAGDIIILSLGRGVSGFGYGVVMILAQDFIMRALGPRARTFASGLYLSVFFAGTICGTLIGSMVAAHVGFANTLLASALVTAGAITVIPLFSRGETVVWAHRFRPLELFRNLRMVGLILFAAIPSRLIISGFIFYLLPLYLHDLGTSKPAAARIMMIYALIMAATAPAWSRLVDRSGRPLLFTIIGVALSGVAMAVIPAGWETPWGVAAAIAILGTAQAIGMSPQITVLFRVGEEEVARFGPTAVLGFYRVCERVGLMVGPMLMAGLVAGWGYGPSLAMLGILMAASGLALLTTFSVCPASGTIDTGADHYLNGSNTLSIHRGSRT